MARFEAQRVRDVAALVFQNFRENNDEAVMYVRTELHKSYSRDADRGKTAEEEPGAARARFTADLHELLDVMAEHEKRSDVSRERAAIRDWRIEPPERMLTLDDRLYCHWSVLRFATIRACGKRFFDSDWEPGQDDWRLAPLLMYVGAPPYERPSLCQCKTVVLRMLALIESPVRTSGVRMPVVPVVPELPSIPPDIAVAGRKGLAGPAPDPAV